MTATRRYALITGASAGIGAEFARQLAARGYSLLLAARSTDKMETLRDEIYAESPFIDICVCTTDLTQPGAARALIEKVHADGVHIDLLVNNAGFGAFGPFGEIDLARQSEMLALNITTLTELAHLCLEPMKERKDGAVLNLASTAAFLPIPYLSVYAATKAYVLSLSRALHAEYSPHNVHVMAVCPGATKTDFFDVAQMDAFAKVRMQTPKQVVTESLKALDGRKTVVICGMGNRLMTFFTGMAPKSALASLIGAFLRRRKTTGK